jgi:hypothetical protein
MCLLRVLKAAHLMARTEINEMNDISISSAILKRLALSESGFVFDPVSGQSFSVNESGLAILRLAQVDNEVESLVENLARNFDASKTEIRRDVLDYADRLKEFLK